MEIFPLPKNFWNNIQKEFCLWKKWPSTVISKKIKLSQAKLSQVELSQAKLSQVNQIGSSKAIEGQKYWQKSKKCLEMVMFKSQS